MDATIDLLGYQITEELYVGNRTLVYRGVQEVDQQPVVIKLLRNEFPSFNELLQFRNQYIIAKNLNSPSIITTYNLENYQNSYALIMEDFGGISLKQWAVIKAGQSLEDFLQMAIALCATLDILYQERIIHKDIKPANILINPATKEIKLIDFSIASLLPRETQEIQNANVLEGTLAYISPEQTGRMNRGIDYRSDFYSLGITFYELLTGNLPFISNDPMELVHCHLAKNPTPVHQVNLEIPLVLSEIISKLMAKNAEDRYQSALGIKHDLELCLTQLQATGNISSFEIGERDISDRFTIPEKLYGREREVQSLLNAFDRIAGGSSQPPFKRGASAEEDSAPLLKGGGGGSPLSNSELILVAGFSGIGKTAVVNEVHKPIARQRGYFIKGKYDQFQRNIPFSAFVQAFRDLMGQLLSESDSQLNTWKSKILEVVGDNGQVLIDVIPELELMIGEQPPATELSGTAAQNRFNLLMQNFIQVFTSQEHPLVMFIDDLQWSDSASQNLLKLLMQDTKYLLVLGAYRDNEVSPAHPFMLTVNEIIRTGAVVQMITLQPLSLEDTNQLVADTLNCPLSLAQPLTELVYRKTNGNPFFATQFLKSLQEDGLIEFNPSQSPLTKGGLRGGWQCDIAKVKAITISDDVVEFMALQLQKLPPETQDVLKLAACIGAQFDLNTLAIVSEKSPEETAADLWRSLQEGFILPTSEIYKFYQGKEAQKTVDTLPDTTAQLPNYKFLHDRIQQAAYSLIPENQKQATHLKMGQLLLQESSETQRQERIFDIVGHFNFARGLISDQKARYELASLNLQAGKAAKAAAAFDAALIFVNTGIESLPTDSWQEQYTLTLALHNLAAEAAYLCSQFEQVAQLITTILQQANQLLDKVSAYEIQLLAYLAQVRPQDGVYTAIDVLRQLGIRLPKNPTQPQVLLGLAKTKLIIGNKKPEQLVNLPTMTDPNKLAAMRILSSAASAAYLCAPKLMPLLVFERVNLSVLYGNTALSAFGYAWYGLILCGILMDIEGGYQFGQLALQLLERFNATDLRAKVLFMTYTFISHWRDRIADTMPELLTAYQSGLETGDVEYAAWAALVHSYNRYWTGDNLRSAEAGIRSFITAIAPFNQKNGSLYIQIYHQATLNLLDDSSDPSCLSGESYRVAEDIPAQVAANDRTGLFFSYVCQQHLNYLFGHYATAIEKSNAAKPYFENCVSSLPTVLHFFYDSLARLAIYATATPLERQQILKCINANQKKLQKWGHYAPINYQHKFLLVEAERYRVLGQKLEAIDYYDRAILLAKENKFLNEEALANELAAKFYLDLSKEKIAQSYIIDAYYSYARWGAKAKVQDLETRYGQLLTPILQKPAALLTTSESISSSLQTLASVHNTVSTGSSTTTVSQMLDIATVLKATQSLYSSIEMDELLSSLMQVIMENAGADKAVLTLNKDGNLEIAAQCLANVSCNLQVFLIDDCQDVPVSVIYYVKRTQETIISTADNPIFASDSYLMQQQQPSFLCMPILNQGKLIGILYLENSLTAGAFTADRIELLKLLCSQAAISLENARLYQAVQQNELKFRALVEDVNDLTFSVNLEATFTYLSPQFQTMLGYEVSDFLNQSFIPLVHPDDLAKVSAFNQQIAETGEKLAGLEFQTQHQNGTWLWVTCNNSPIKDGQGQVIGIRGIARDISDRKRAESVITQKSQELEQALKNLQQTQLQVIQAEKMSALGNLVAGVAHEINNPVGFLGGNIKPALDYINDLFGLLDLYQQKYSQPDADIQSEIEAIDLDYIREDLPKLVGSMREGVKRIADISTSLRTFSRADSDRPVACNIHEGIDSTIMILKHRLKANEARPDIQIIKQYGNLPQIECYSGQMNQVFMNILANAIDALDESNHGCSFEEIKANPNCITVTTSVENNNVKIVIADNGKGISEEVKVRVFDHLFTTKEVGKGTGLGLAIAQQIIQEKHHGTIDVNSELGQGTEFLITLPITYSNPN